MQERRVAFSHRAISPTVCRTDRGINSQTATVDGGGVSEYSLRSTQHLRPVEEVILKDDWPEEV